MRVNSRKIIKILEEMAPMEYAESWDSVGLQLGNGDMVIDKIMVALEVTAEVAAEAEEKSVDLLLVHHPLIFKPLKSITEDHPLERSSGILSAQISMCMRRTRILTSPGAASTMQWQIFLTWNG